MTQRDRLSSSRGLRAVDDKPWRIETERHRDGYIVTKMSGIADALFAMEVRRQVLAQVGPGYVDWIPDALGITKFESSLLKEAPKVLKDFKTSGGRFVVAAISLGPIRMAASIISMSSLAIKGPSIGIKDTLQEAVQELNRLRKSEVSPG
jgi:hypothetical protein